MKSFRRKSATEYPIYPHAFDFLSECSSAIPEVDMTSAASISDPPESIVKTLSEYNLSYGLGQSLTRGESKGSPECLAEISRFFSRKGILCGEENVSMNDGILSSISKTYEMLGLDSSDKVIVPIPTFGYYFKQFQDKRIAFETLPVDENFLVDPIKLEEAIERTGARVLLLCYPNNPTGTPLTRESAEAIAEVVKKHDIFVISDEVFMENYLSEENKHCSIASIDGMLERSITLTSISKMMGMPSVRTSICVGSKEIMDSFAKLGGYPEIDQMIISSAISDTAENQEYLENDRCKYRSNINLIRDRVSHLNNVFKEQFPEDGENKIFVKPLIDNPESGNVYLLDFSGLKGKMHERNIINTGLNVSQWLLREASVGTVPGECFMFDENKMIVRIALGHSHEEINKAFDNMCGAVEKIQTPPLHLRSRSNSPNVISK